MTKVDLITSSDGRNVLKLDNDFFAGGSEIYDYQWLSLIKRICENNNIDSEISTSFILNQNI